ncbi:GntR family transcriptional regulator [Halanaerocella petrolearia]
MKKVSKENPLPLYYQLKEILQDMIENEVLKPGDPIPTERELVEMHDISRMTARKAIMALVNEGLLYREQGRGTFVADPEPKMKHQLSKLSGFTKEMKEKGLKTSTKLLSFEVETPSKKVSEHLELPEEVNQVIKIKRLRFVEDDPFSIETAWLPSDLCSSLTEDMLIGSSLYDIFKEEYGYELDYARQTIEPTMITEYEKELFAVDVDLLALLFRRTTYLKTDRIIEYTKATYRSDKYKHEVILK